MTVPEVLRKAAATVREGWCQFAMYDGRGSYCAAGAINELTLESFKVRTMVCAALQDALGLSTQKGWHCFCPITVWNDAQGQTAENVAQGLEYAALVWEQQEQAKTASLQTPETWQAGV